MDSELFTEEYWISLLNEAECTFQGMTTYTTEIGTIDLYRSDDMTAYVAIHPNQSLNRVKIQKRYSDKNGEPLYDDGLLMLWTDSGVKKFVHELPQLMEENSEDLIEEGLPNQSKKHDMQSIYQ